MRPRIFQTARFRRGVAAVMFGLMLPLFIGFTALAVDIAVIAVARSQLSTAADSAALAGAQQLAAERVLGVTTLTSAIITTINKQAGNFAQSNTVLGATPVLSTSLSEIVVGDVDLTDPSSILNSSSSTTLFNSVQVTLSRDSTHGGPVPAFFSSIWGSPGTPVSVPSTASIRAYQVTGFKANGSLSASLLPIALDMTTWLNMMPPTFRFQYGGTTKNGTASPTTATDQYTYNASNNTVTNGADGIYESQFYPVSSGSPGNWGTVNIGVSNNGTSTLRAQIQSGITPAQLATFPNSTIQLDSTQSPPSITFTGNPGISTGIKSALTAIIGQPCSIPIYDTNGGSGANAWYRVIAFQPARILSVNFQGKNKYVIVQPCLTNDPTATAIPHWAQPWTSGGHVNVFLSR